MIVELSEVGQSKSLEYTNGLLWVIRNLSFLDATYKNFGKKAIKLIEQLLPHIEQTSTGNLGA